MFNPKVQYIKNAHCLQSKVHQALKNDHYRQKGFSAYIKIMFMQIRKHVHHVFENIMYWSLSKKMFTKYVKNRRKTNPVNKRRKKEKAKNKPKPETKIKHNKINK